MMDVRQLQPGRWKAITERIISGSRFAETLTAINPDLVAVVWGAMRLMLTVRPSQLQAYSSNLLTTNPEVVCKCS